jgi:hypothetical protein
LAQALVTPNRNRKIADKKNSPGNRRAGASGNPCGAREERPSARL